MPKTQVQKRSGEFEDVSFDKITERIQNILELSNDGLKSIDEKINSNDQVWDFKNLNFGF